MADTCTDNRFEIIAKAKADLLEGTNINTSPIEMAVIDNILFRCWQMGWLDRYAEQTEPQTDYGDFADRLAYERGVKHAWEVAQKVFDSTVTFYEAEDVAKQIAKTEPQTCANGCKWLDVSGECTEPNGECHIEYRTDEPQTDCSWK